jgi:hypothetical protein
MEADVLSSPNVPNKGLTVNTCGKGSDNASIRDVLEFFLLLCKAFDVRLSLILRLHPRRFHEVLGLV